MRRLKPTEKMLDLLRHKFKLQIPPDATIDRVRGGYWQRKNGALSWMLVAEGFGSLGSQTPITELLRCPNLVIEDVYSDRIIDCGCKGKCKGLEDRRRRFHTWKCQSCGTSDIRTREDSPPHGPCPHCRDTGSKTYEGFLPGRRA